MKPPRGRTENRDHAPLATARWATPEEIAAYAYRPGDLFLGTIPFPAPEAKRALEELQALRAMILADTLIKAEWKAAQLATIAAHEEDLAQTSSLTIGVRDDRHMVTVAGTRSGKGTSAIIPNLCLFPGSVLAIDPKGELARLTLARRGKGSAKCKGLGQKAAALDPYNTTRLPKSARASWNPLDLLRQDDPEMVDKAASIAEALIVRAKAADAHWDDSARAFIKALILFVAIAHEGEPSRNLLTVYDLLMRGAWQDLDSNRDNPQPDDALTMLLMQMQSIDALDGVVAGAAASLLDMGERERGSVLSTARRNLEFLERPAMREVLRTSSFNLEDIKTAPEGMTLYLCLPPQRMADCGRWLRLMINVALERVIEIEAPPATGHPILFLLEEFASLGHMQTIENAAGYAAGFGVKLWVVIQDLSQLKRQYKEGWETFLGNAGVLQAFGNSDATTLDYLSKKLGETEVAQSVNSTTTSLTASSNDPGEAQRLQGLMQNRGAISLFANPMSLFFDHEATGQSASTTTATNVQVHRAALMLPDEIERFFRREAGTQLVSIKGQRPFILDRVNYYDSPLFAGLFEADGQAPSVDDDTAGQQARTRAAIEGALAYARQTVKDIAAAVKSAPR